MTARNCDCLPKNEYVANDEQPKRRRKEIFPFKFVLTTENEAFSDERRQIA